MNKDPHAPSRASEITAAYAVLGNREKRAAYDARLTRGICVPARERRVAPRQRRVGINQRSTGRIPCAHAAALTFAAALAAVASSLAVWPDLRLPSRNDGRFTVAAQPSRTRLRARMQQTAPADSQAQSEGPSQTHVTSPPHDLDPVKTMSGPSTHDVVSSKNISGTGGLSGELRSGPGGVRTAAFVNVSVSDLFNDAPASQRPRAPALPENCRGRASVKHSCADEQDRAERNAKSLFTQSMANADPQKQQLLLSARNRSTAARAMCRSEDCVKDAYLQQFRDTVLIMEGGIPRP